MSKIATDASFPARIRMLLHSSRKISWYRYWTELEHPSLKALAAAPGAGRTGRNFSICLPPRIPGR